MGKSMQLAGSVRTIYCARLCIETKPILNLFPFSFISCSSYRTISFGVLTGAITFSVLSGLSCEFFSFESITGIPWIGLTLPLDSTTGADLGLFGYRITDSVIQDEITTECLQWDDFFMDLEIPTDDSNETFWITAQFGQVLAVTLGGLAWILLVLDCFILVECPYLLPTLSLFGAMACQGCTFFIFLENEFCFHSESTHTTCRLESGGWFSVAAMGGYFLACIMVCGLPRTHACFLKKTGTISGRKVKLQRDASAEPKNTSAAAVSEESFSSSSSSSLDFKEQGEASAEPKKTSAAAVSEESSSSSSSSSSSLDFKEVFSYSDEPQYKKTATRGDPAEQKSLLEDEEDMSDPNSSRSESVYKD